MEQQPILLPMPSSSAAGQIRKRNVFDVLNELQRRRRVRQQQKEEEEQVTRSDETHQGTVDTAPTVVVRVDFNVPMTTTTTTTKKSEADADHHHHDTEHHESREIADESRIRAALPTIRAILRARCNAVLISHMGRPKRVQKAAASSSATLDSDEIEQARRERSDLSLKPVAVALRRLLLVEEHDDGIYDTVASASAGGSGTITARNNDDEDDESPSEHHRDRVIFANDCIGHEAKEAISRLPPTGGGVVLLENLRFHAQEEKNDPDFAKSLAEHGDAYVNDAFGTCHRAHSSVAGVPAFLDAKLCGVGCLVASEISFLDFRSVVPRRRGGERIAAIIGGSKVSTKLPVIRGLLRAVDTLVLGGGLAFTFMKARGIPIGGSLLEEGMVDIAASLLEEAEATGKELLLPVDAVCAREFPRESASSRKADTKTFDLLPGGTGVEDGWMGLDVGPRTVSLFRDALENVSRLVFNGPMGVFEVPPFDEGTRGLVKVLSDLTKDRGCVTVVGGGDSVSALEAFGRTDDVTYVSTGGGVTLELLAGKDLPGVDAIENFAEEEE